MNKPTSPAIPTPEELPPLESKLERLRRQYRETDADGTQRAYALLKATFQDAGLTLNEDQDPRIPWRQYPPTHWHEFCRCLNRALLPLIAQGAHAPLVRRVLAELIPFAAQKPDADPVTQTATLLSGFFREIEWDRLQPLLPPDAQTLLTSAREQFQADEASAEADRERQDQMSY